MVGAIAVGGLVGCGDNKPKMNGGGDGGLCSGSFVSPADTSTLTIADDLNHSCAGSLHTNVSLATSQADGTSVDLYVGGTKVASATVMGAEAHFANVQLAQGENALNAVFSATCSLMAKVTVDCHLPMCNITKPVLSATHTALNGVAAAMNGDRASAIGSPYQVEFDVVTDVEDGQPVQLKITTGSASTSTTIVQGTAVSGKTTFPGVTLVPDGNYTIEADCTNKAGVLGQSTKGTYPVDSTAPVLSISSPSNGKFFGPTELINGAFQVCAQTPDKDADRAAGCPRRRREEPVRRRRDRLARSDQRLRRRHRDRHRHLRQRHVHQQHADRSDGHPEGRRWKPDRQDHLADRLRDDAAGRADRVAAPATRAPSTTRPSTCWPRRRPTRSGSGPGHPRRPVDRRRLRRQGRERDAVRRHDGRQPDGRSPAPSTPSPPSRRTTAPTAIRSVARFPGVTLPDSQERHRRLAAERH